MKRWRLYTILVVCTVLPLLLFLYAADLVVRKTTTSSILKATGPAAELAANAITDRMSDAKSSLETLASDPSLLDAWSHHDTRRLVSTLRMSRGLMGGAASMAVYDRNGNLLAVDPDASGRANASSIASSGWFTTAMQSGKPYVSGVATVAGDGSAVTVAAPLHPEHPDGVLVAVYTIDTVRSWMSSIAPANMKWLGIVDQNGVILAGGGLGAPGQIRDVSSRPEVKQVLAGKDGTEFLSLEGRQVLVSRLPVPSLGWGVLVEIPAGEIDAFIWKGERPIAIVALIFVGLALAIGIVIASLYRRLRESEEHTRQIISAATNAYIAIDQKSTITDWNPKAEETFGWSKAEALGQPLHATIIPPQYRDAHLRGMAHLRATGEGPVLNTRIELSALHRNGREFPIELSITRVYRGGKVCFNAFLHDITTRKRAQEEIETLNAELHVRVSELEERNKALEAFSYSVSHDVRAPLRNIAGFSEILREEYARQLSPPAMDYLQRIQSNVARMQRLVDDLLRFARLGEQGLKLQRTDLDQIVRQVIASLESEVAGREVKFEVGSLPSVECDPGLVTQVFWNLLANAVKFTRGGKNAVISVGLSSQDDEDVLFVRDNGVGFDMKQAGKLFGAFQRLHRSDEFEGTGVGLATVQRIIVKHHGRIWAHSELDRGATFFFSLWPAKPVDQPVVLAQAR